ncbi:hypothetical protein AMECASPLE_011248 [Ameca splendens]|uniref:TACI cysteine-rich domain-containing protein n=1 Tax=Ameca splendens TaxID=208324 RepID=A0ABV0YN73_9TELE
MGGRCKEGEHLDGLTRSCIPCRMVCQQPPAVPRCAVYCEATLCKAKPGHYYDRLVRRCIKCAEICGKHPAECSPYCTTQSPPATTKRLPFEVSRQAVNTRLPPGLLDPTIQLYALLGVCTMLLFSSLCLALILFHRQGKAKNLNKRSTSTRDEMQKCAVQPGQEESSCPGGQSGRSPKDFLPSSSLPTYRKPSEDSFPTETCVCMHCFPDLRGLGQDSDRPQRAPYSFYQQGILHRAHIQNGGSLWTGDSLRASGPDVQQEAAMG